MLVCATETMLKPKIAGACYAPLASVIIADERLKNTPVDAEETRALTEAMRHGDEAAFSRFYDLYAFRIYKYLLVLARGDETDAKDVCQTVMLKLAKPFAVFDEERHLWAWLCKLARNAFIDHCRIKQRQSRFISLEEMALSVAGPEVSDGCLSALLREALAELSAEDWELIQAAYVDERPLKKLAEDLGQTYKGLECRLARLRHKLKETLLKKLRHEHET